MKLIIVHYHLRPGGVRRIIELATQHLVRESKNPVTSVVLASGERGDEAWQELFSKSLNATPVRFVIDPAFGYVSDKTSGKQVSDALLRLLDGECLVWAHNLGIGRNLLLTQALVKLCAARRVPLVAHHHDWWFDNRWRHWQRMKSCGFASLAKIAETIFAGSPNLHHLTINQADARLLQQTLPGCVSWLPNLTEPEAEPSATKVQQARLWLRGKVRATGGPIWLLPGRILRRKNIAEALLLTRWLRPGAWLCGTAGVSSQGERDYAAILQRAARKHEWPLRLGVLENGGPGPSVRQLMAASEVILMTSLQEGFGLPYLEAAAAGRPLIARSIPNVAPDLKQLGFKFPQMYKEILVAPGLFDCAAEKKRQERLFQTWRAQLPLPARKWVGIPMLAGAGKMPAPVPFSRLTLTAQLEVLSVPSEHSWNECAPLNPFLQVWRTRAEAGKLQTTSWPGTANDWLSGQAYARRFWNLVRRRPIARTKARAARLAQERFIREKLVPENLFPLLWAAQT